MFYTGHPAGTTSSDDSFSVETVAQGQGSSANEKVVQESESHSGTTDRVLVFPSPEKIKKNMEIYYSNFSCARKDEACEEKLSYHGSSADSTISNSLVDQLILNKTNNNLFVAR